jgi:hypothetical protein
MTDQDICDATELREKIAAKIDTMCQEEKERELVSVWETMKLLVNESGEINDTVREIYEEIIVLLKPNIMEYETEPEELSAAHRVSDYIFLNAQKLTQMELEEWSARLYDLLTAANTHKAHELLNEAMLNVAYYLDNYAANNPVAEDRYDEAEEEQYGPCDHGKKYHEHCYNCADEAEEAEERFERMEERTQKAVEYNLWYKDGGYKEMARQG